jgi:hypothetical protein
MSDVSNSDSSRDNNHGRRAIEKRKDEEETHSPRRIQRSNGQKVENDGNLQD